VRPAAAPAGKFSGGASPLRQKKKRQKKISAVRPAAAPAKGWRQVARNMHGRCERHHGCAFGERDGT